MKKKTKTKPTKMKKNKTKEEKTSHSLIHLPNVSIHVLHTFFLYISQAADKETFMNNQELL